MKGARGLLVSITGGNDLTLYEVDEAATRIREEVDQEANIIVGATFDESLEGIIRVSVVATGIDMADQPASTQDARLAELAQKLRTQPQRATRPEQIATAARTAVPAEHAGYAEEEHVDSSLPPAANFEDVTIRPMAPKPTLFADVSDERQQTPVPESKSFIPPQPERARQTPRMPRIDELPLPAQNEIRARRGEVAATAPEKPRMSLLQRLASVGLGRARDEAEAPAERPAPRAVARAPERPTVPQPQPVPRPQEARYQEQARYQESVSEYGRRPAPVRPAPQGLDLHGRPAPMPGHSVADDDQLEIPAFLRRQAH